ncbi:diguanylate cyclase response regulator [Vibrio albus]|jgi:diguanylate cyclase (GGDEF)-like protein|uniref:diguanylate cyclase n=1 Tax=Vibrio albus TaxID=2200953 RepID=A0A2U3B703_9VIBR|nr:diguanylate cyclase [Vibrio albus]PWI32567.1 diguanylate cyclase response regulator [Vibrio albus]
MENNQRILIVDDEIINLKVLSELFRDKVQLTLAKSGHQALRKAEEVRPDLILLDIRMPGLNGFETLDRLRQNPSTAHIPVIFISGLDDDDHEEKGLKLGAADYIFKPFKLGIVQARVRTHLQLAQQTKMLERLANSDALTSLANRRQYNKTLYQEWHQAIEESAPITIAIFDIDNFKQFNDRHGHDTGDQLLQKVSDLLRDHFSHPRHLVARFGGEEFVVLMPKFGREDAFPLIQQCIEKISQNSDITLSAGGASCHPAEQGCSRSKLFSLADKALYIAKNQGKNCAVWSERY